MFDIKDVLYRYFDYTESDTQCWQHVYALRSFTDCIKYVPRTKVDPSHE